MFNEKGNYQYPGDMVKSTYDSNNDGVVNAADSVPWSGVTNTPDTLSGYGIEDVPASVLSGIIGLEHIPPSAVERMKIVENDSMRFALTTADVQNGDTVKVTATNKMYLVVDDGNLDSESGYMVYEAGRAAAVDWTGVENKPETIENIDDILDTSEEESEAGNPITIVTDSAQIAKSTHLTFEPIQDLHGYDHPWPAGGGKNLLQTTAQDKTQNGVTWTVNSDGTVTASGTATGYTDLLIGRAYVNAQMGTVIISGLAGTANLVWAFFDLYNSNDERVEQITAGSYGDYTVDLSQYSDVSYIIATVKRNNNVATSGTIYPMIRLATEQDATFAPYSNICPISGLDEVEVKRTGFNVWDEEWELGGLVWTTGQPATTTDRIRSKNYCPCRPSTTYYAKSPNGMIYGFWYDSEKNYIGYDLASNTNLLTTPVNAAYFKIVNTGITSVNQDISINYPSTDHDYHAYNGQQVTVQLGQTVYGGTLDLETGELVCDRGMRLVGECYWHGSNGVFYTESVLNNIIHGDGRFDHVISDTYKTQNVGTSGSLSDGEISVDASGYIQLIDMRYTVVSNFKQAMNGVQLCYELATPITYTLTPKQLSLLKGTNRISTNAKSVKVTFRAGQLATLEDVAGAVKIADEHLETALTPILGDFADIETSPVASNHAVGEYLIYDSKLYKVIAAITAGESLAEGTNIQRTTVMAELIALTQ